MNDTPTPPVETMFQRTVQRFWTAWRGVSSALGTGNGALRPDLPDADADRVRERMRACLQRLGGEISARGRAAELGRSYLSLDATGRQRFLRILATEFDTDRESVVAAAAGLDELDDWSGRKNAERRLRAALYPPRIRLLTQFNALPQGVKFLVDMREELLNIEGEDPELGALEADLKDLLTSWFDVGFLELRRMTWDSPAAILEKLIEYEAVHEITSWGDLKNRLASDRRCYAFFHPRMPDEPLIFVEVALTSGIADSVQDLLDEMGPVADPAKADTAIFYSISNAQRGLDGIGFGGFLIKRVVDQLAAEIPAIKNFSTLSPIPGFRRWLDRQGDDELLSAAEMKALANVAPDGSEETPLRAILADSNWAMRSEFTEVMNKPLTRLCAHYLAEEKRDDGHARDPVAHFHLSNGARMERLNWLADVSDNGIRQSAGMMINYLYVIDEIEDNHESYTGEGNIPASSSIRNLLKRK